MILCSADTLAGELRMSMKEVAEKENTARKYPCRIVQGRTRSDYGFRIDSGIASYYYQPETAEWIGQHGSPAFGFVFVYNKKSVECVLNNGL